MKLISKIVLFTIIVGVIGIALNTIIGSATVTYLTKVNVKTLNTNFYYWRFDFWRYFENVRLSATNITELSLNLPTRQWRNINNASDLYLIGNNLAVVLDYMIVLINVLLYPIKINAYLLKNVLAILGVNSQNVEGNGLYWLQYFVSNIMGNFSIPYI